MWLLEKETLVLFKDFSISNTQIKQILKFENVTYIKEGKSLLFSKFEVMTLIKRINELYKYNEENMLTTKQLIEMGLKSSSQHTKFDRKDLTLIEKVREFKKCNLLYKKEAILKLLENKKVVLTEYLNIAQSKDFLELANYNKFHLIAKEFNLEGVQFENYNGHFFYKLNELENIKKIINDKYIENKKKYFNARELYDIGFNNFDAEKFPKKEAETSDKIGKFVNSVYMYDRTAVLEKYKNISTEAVTYTSNEAAIVLDIPKYQLNEYLKINNISPHEKPHVKSFIWKKEDIDNLSLLNKKIADDFFNNYVGKNELLKFLNITWGKIDELVQISGLKIELEIFPIELRKKKYQKEIHCIKKVTIKNIAESLLEFSDILKLTNKESLLKLKSFNSKNPWGMSDSSKRKQVTPRKNKIKNIEEINQIFKYSGSVEQFYEDLRTYSASKNNEGIKEIIISINDIYKKYNISKHIFGKLEATISPPTILYNHTSYYPLHIIEAIFEESIKKQNDLLQNYYTREQALNLGLTERLILKIENSISIPDILRFGELSKFKLYPKSVVTDLLRKQIKKNIHLERKKDIAFTTTPADVFMNIIDSLKDFDCEFQFSENIRITKDEWFKFATRHINKSEGNFETIYSLILTFVELTELLMKNIVEKEIIEMTANEINLSIFSSGISPYSLQHINTFLRELKDNFETNYNIERFINIFEIIEKEKKVKDKKFYTIEEYLKLIEYVSKVEMHKRIAIEEFENVIRGSGNKKVKYNEYESVWLYVILHLNNAWRSKDFIYKIPRINVPKGIYNLEDFKHHTITLEQAEIIIAELAAKIIGTRHNKNNKEAYFFCSDAMKIPLANALILCEIKCRMFRPLNNNLIKLTDDDKLNTTLNKKFFSNFSIEGFVFRSLAANRSFITIINMVLKKTTNRNPLELTKYIRNHHSINMTDTYVQISDIELNHLSKSLFNTGYFGHTYDLLLKSVLGVKSTFNLKLGDTNDYELIKNIFGDITKIENVSVYMNHLNNYNSLYEFINDLDNQKKMDLLNLVALEQIPAKEKYWQCILGNCIYMNRNCDACPFAIPHMYALTKILDNLDRFMSEYESLVNNIIFGEKRRLANLIYRNLLLLSSAKNKFGEKVLESFLGYKYNELKKRIANLDEIYEYLSIKEIKHVSSN